MLCEKCGKKEATFYYKENVNGTTKTYKLCADCAAEMQKSGEIQTNFGEDPFSKMLHLFGGDDFFGDSLFGGTNLFGSLIGAPQKNGAKTSRTCPLCGSSFGDFVHTGKAGCPQCYETFAAELEPSIRRIHGRTAHTGQAPARFRVENEKKQKIAALEKELKEAIAAEEYEKAAGLRDTLRELKGETPKNTDGEQNQ